jgi:hypothetical protein
MLQRTYLENVIPTCKKSLQDRIHRWMNASPKKYGSSLYRIWKVDCRDFEDVSTCLRLLEEGYQQVLSKIDDRWKVTPDFSTHWRENGAVCVIRTVRKPAQIVFRIVTSYNSED